MYARPSVQGVKINFNVHVYKVLNSETPNYLRVKFVN